MADVAQGNQAGHTAVDNNALRNSKGESKLNTQEKILNEKLKKAGVQSADDYQRKYDACKTDQCRIQVEKEYLKASDEANKIILNLYMTGQITEEESKILLTSYANKMMRGAGESQRRFGSRIFDLNANEWIPASVIGNADFNQITMLNLVKKMKRSGASDEQIAIRVFQYQIAGSYIGSVSIMQQQVDTLLNSGVSVETVIRALSMKKGRRLTNDEIGLIKNRYSVMMQKQGSKAKAGKGATGTINTTQAGNVATSSVKVNIANDFTKNPQSIWGKSADDIAKDFQAAGYQVNVRQSSRGSGQAVIVEVKGHSEISQVQIHPGGGRHGGSYYKVSTTTQGTIKVVDSNTYKPSAGEKAKIINKPKE